MQLRDLLDELPRGNDAVIPLALQQLLRQDLNIKEDWQTAEQLLLKAQIMLPEQLEVKIALYKLYAYSNRFEESLRLINEVLNTVAGQEGFDRDWRTLTVTTACWYPAVGRLRYFLYSLKASGFVYLRSGDIDQAYAVLRKLLELDPQDQVGGSVVLELAQGLMEEES